MSAESTASTGSTGPAGSAALPRTERPQVVLATHSAHKLGELRSILAGALDGVLADVEVLAAGDLGLGDVAETGTTFTENALIKARAVAAATGLPALADDSGIAVDVLGGSPGIFSARWSGRHGDDAANLALLLAQVADIPDAHRGAGYVCAAALVVPAGGPLPPVEHVELGRLAGTLARAPRGTNGFGYDPVVVPTGLQVTCAEMSPAEKEAISHRGQAFRAMAPHLARALGLALGPPAARG